MFAYGFWKMGSVAFRVQRHWLFFVVWMQLMLTAPAQAQYLSHFDVVDSFNAFWYDLFGTVEPGDLTAPVAVATDENFEALLQDSKDKTWILEFYAPWCKHCQQYAPMYEEAAERVPGLRFAKVDATAHTQVAEDYDVTGYPTLKMVRDGYVRNYRGALLACQNSATRARTTSGVGAWS
jgi:protein disulfide-isomerase-like protein